MRLDLEKSSPSKDIILTPTLDPDIGKGLTIDQAKKKLNYFLRYGEYLQIILCQSDLQILIYVIINGEFQSYEKEQNKLTFLSEDLNPGF